MLHAIINPDTGEILTFTEDQIQLMADHSPAKGDKGFLIGRILVENHIELSSDEFYYVCYLAARVWLGVKGVSEHPA